ncbi:MAG: PLP-dependent aminotransferase family protein [Candidatus Melainabacteria bacterium]|nr:MAG: PLP-dependent aminotransferase family protein [Candidatus Melainabacteria bacterium]
MDFVLNLEYDPNISLYRRLSDALRKAIIEGRLKPGQLLPSVRDLSATLNVSRATVVRAFQDLESQGYVDLKKGLNSKVASRLPGDLSGLLPRRLPPSQEGVKKEAPETTVFSSFGERLFAAHVEDYTPRPHSKQTNFGGTPLNLLPLQHWKRLLIDHCRFKDLSRLSYHVDPFGYAPLREAVGAFLVRSRAVNCSADRIMVSSGREMRLDLICRLLLDPGDAIAMEEPGYPSLRRRALSHGAHIEPIPLTENGMDVDYLSRIDRKFKFVLVTPSHHEPTGIVMSLEMRRKLLAWAKKTQTFIIEDDFDSEHRYGIKPIPSLQGLDDGDLVIYMRCFWRVLFPLMRLGFLVLPERLKRAMRLAKNEIERDPPILDQFTLTDFINEGYLERHIRRIQPIYAHQRTALIYSLTKYFRNHISLSPCKSGLDLRVVFDLPISDQELAQLALENGVSMIRTFEYYMTNPPEGEFMLSFGHVQEQEVLAGVKRLAEALRKSGKLI